MKGKRLTLRAVEPGDISRLYDWENRSDMWIVSGTHTPFSFETLKKYVHSVQDIHKDEQLRLMIDLDQKTIGILDLFELSSTNRRVGIGILIDEEFRNRGFAKEAIEIALDYCFKTLNLHQVYCHILSNNEKSIKLFESLGFEKTGELKEWVLQDGNYLDEWVYQKIKN